MAEVELKMGGLRAPYHATPTQSTSINIQSEPHMPDPIIWSLFNALFLNCCCLGFVACTYSVKSRDRMMVGDMTGAQNHATTAKCLNIFVILLAVGTVMSQQGH